MPRAPASAISGGPPRRIHLTPNILLLAAVSLVFATRQFPDGATSRTGGDTQQKPFEHYHCAKAAPGGGALPALSREARPNVYFDAAGARSFLCGAEDGAMEAWVWPYQIFHGAKLSFKPARALEFVDLGRYAAEIEVEPDATSILYKSPDIFLTMRAVCLDGPRGAILLLTADIDAPGTLAFTFIPKLQPQWPAAVGGVAAAWKQQLGGFVISEPSARAAAALGSPRASRATEGVQYLLPDGALRIEIDLDPKMCNEERVPIAIAAAEGPGAPAAAEASYVDLLLNVHEHINRQRDLWRARIEEMTTIETPDAILNNAFFWNVIALQQGYVKSDALGDGLVAGYGPAGASSQRPGFAWFFTGDVGLNAPAYAGGGLADALAVGVRFAARHQRADGKIPHEVALSAHLCDWFDKYPFAYIHGETTALWIRAASLCIDTTGDRALAAQWWPHAKKGFHWLLQQDENGDGLPDNTKAGMGASEVGPLREDLLTDCYLAAAAAAAFRDVERWAAWMNDNDTAARAAAAAARAREAFESQFWSEELGAYAHSLLTNGRRSAERTPWPAAAVAFGAAGGERARRTMSQIGAPNLTTPWGVRILASDSKYYDPKGYNSGAVWPFLTGIAALADFKTGRADEGYKKLSSAAVLTFAHALGRAPEVLSGARPRPLDTSVPHQLFSSMAVAAPAVEGIFGYAPRAAEGLLLLEPAFPAAWREAKLMNAMFGAARLDITYTRAGGEYNVNITARRGEPPREVKLAPRNGAAGRVETRPARNR